MAQSTETSDKWGQKRQTLNINPWYAFDDLKPFFDAVKSGEWEWGRNCQFKYVDIRIDTRGGHIIIKNRDGNSVTMAELMAQYDPDVGSIAPFPGYVDPMKLTELEGQNK